MTRLLSTMTLDVRVQIRNNLYNIGIGVAILVALVLSQLVLAEQLSVVIPIGMMLVIGGSTLLYVAGMILFEKDEGTISAAFISPLRPSEYLISKTVTLTTLASLEGAIMIAGTTVLLSLGQDVTLPNIPILLVGVVATGVMYTLIGIIIVVRYDKITEFLIPMALIAVVLQLSFLYFTGFVETPLLLVIPVSAPTMLMSGAYHPLTTPEWVYAIGYTTLLLVGLAVWAYRAFETHIINDIG